MKISLRGLIASTSTLCWLMCAQPSAAQWTSNFEYVNLAASFNDFNTSIPNMQLISNGLWVTYVELPAWTAATTTRFLFATSGFGTTWKEANQSDFDVPISGVTDFGGTNDIFITNHPPGIYRFQLRESNREYSVQNVTPGTAAGTLWFNEIHYDNASTDSNEMVEVMGVAGLSLTNYQIVLYNGGNGAAYSTLNLTGSIPNQVNGYGTAAFFINGIQNGSPDGLALVRRSPQSVLWFISYEGAFTATDGPASGMISTGMPVAQAGTEPWDQSLQLTGFAGDYPGFTWTGPTNRTPGQVNVGQGIATGSPAVSITFSNLVVTPSVATTTTTVHVDVDIYPILGATNIFATTFYRNTTTMPRFLPLPMSRTGNHYRTINPIPAQPASTIVEYYIFAHYTGNGTGSPDVFPANAPTNLPSYGVFRVAPGAVWINEINPDPAFGPEGSEFVEIIGVAGTDLSNWSVLFYDGSNSPPTAAFTIPAGSQLGNQSSGYGFFMLGASNVPGVDVAWSENADVIPNVGGLKLKNELNETVYALNWSTDTTPIVWPGFQFIGGKDGFFGTSNAISLIGTGSNYINFSWVSEQSYSPNTVNPGQTLTGGNTNNLPPMILCPSNLFFSCPNAVIPPPDTAALVATGYCGSGAVTVTLVSSVTNSGTGCLNNPKIVTRTYRAVSACNTTSECQQIIRVEDTTPPVLLCNTTSLINASFEFVDYTGWTTFGAGLDNITIASVAPKAGFRHASLRGASSSAMLDTSGNELSGLYFGRPNRGQSGTNAINSTAVRFTGTNQYAEVPYSGLLNDSSFSFAMWVKPAIQSNPTRSLLSSRQFTISEVSGYHVQLSSSNSVQFWTGDGVFWDIQNGPGLTNLAWVHLAGVVSNNGSTASKQLWINGVLSRQSVITNYLPNTTRPLRVAAGATETDAGDFFAGWMDDVRLYNAPLSASQITSLYNNGSAGITLGSEVAYYSMNESNVTGVSTSGFHQTLAAKTGEIWTASAWAFIPSTDPLSGSNNAYLTLSYLNNTGNVLSVYTSKMLNVASPVTNFLRLTARGPAPSNTASARLTAVFNQDSNGSPGTVYFDAAVLSTLVVLTTTNCPTMPNVLSLASATDSCPGSVTITQYPTIGTTITPTNSTVVFRATDACGLVSTCTLDLIVVDDIPPTINQPAPLTASCTNAMPAPAPQSIVATDNCGPALVTWLHDTVMGGHPCQATNPIVVHRLYQATDQAGNFVSSTQTITVVDTNPPSMNCAFPLPLSNPGFEVGTFQSWNTFGINKFVVTNLPRSGTRHALLKGTGAGGDNFTGFYQDSSARSGQTWRLSGYAMTPTTNPVSGASTCEIKLEFYGATGLLATHLAPLITSSTTPGVYQPYTVVGVAPAGTTIARFTVVYIQRGGAAGEVFLDDTSLSQFMVSASGASCQATLPDLTKAATASDCGTVSISQSPPAGTLIGLGNTFVDLIALDGCGLSRTCLVVVTAVDDVCSGATPPAPTNVTVVGFSLGPTITVRSLGTNSWSVAPEYSTNLMGQPQTWLPVSAWTNTHLNGTNITSFNPPVTNQAVLYRVWQKYP